MKVKEILAKIVKGEQLSDEEKKFLETYDPESDESRIPKKRLDDEIAKRKTLEEKSADLEAKVEELSAKLEDQQTSGMGEVDKLKAVHAKELGKLQKQVETLTHERDEAVTNLGKAERGVKISSLSTKHKFRNPAYFDYLAKEKEIDLDDEEAVDAFVKGLEKDSPELFNASVKPGGGTKSGDSEISGAKERIKELLGKPSLSSRESQEVIRLQESLKTSTQETNNNKGE